MSRCRSAPPRCWPRRAFAVAALGAILACGGPAGVESRVDLVAVPEPELGAMEEPVRRQLEEKRGALEALGDDVSAAERAAAYGELGQLYHAYELYEAAEAAYRNAHRLAPEEFRWAYYLGVALQARGELEEAAEVYGRALSLRPDDLPARVRLGETNLALGRLEAARAALERALAVDPGGALAHYFLGQVEASAGQAAAAARHFERALELQPRATAVRYPLAQAYREIGEEKKAAALLAELGDADVRLDDPLLGELEALKTGAAALIRRAGKAQLAGDVRGALAEYRKAVAVDPRNPEAHHGLGLMLAESGEPAAAIAELRRALELDEGNALVHYNLGGLLFRSRELAEAIEHYRAALAIDPQLASAWRMLARALAEAGELGDAEAAYRRLLELEPSDGGARIELAGVHARGGDAVAARGLLRSVLERDATGTERARAHLELAALAGSPADALEHYRQAIAAAPDQAATHFALANHLGGAGRYREAAAAYRRALELEPAHRRARLGEATALALAGDVAAARRSLEEGLEELPGDPDLRRALEQLREAAGRG